MHSVVFGGFAPKELAVRIRDAAPKVIVTSSCGLEKGRVVLYRPLLAKALEIASEAGHTPGHVVVHQRTEAAESLAPLGDDLDFDEVYYDLLRLFSTHIDLHQLTSPSRAGCRRGVAARRGASRGECAPVYAVHLGHHRPAEGNPARQYVRRRAAGRA